MYKSLVEAQKAWGNFNQKTTHEYSFTRKGDSGKVLVQVDLFYFEDGVIRLQAYFSFGKKWACSVDYQGKDIHKALKKLSKRMST